LLGLSAAVLILGLRGLGSHYKMTSCLEKLSMETIIFDETLSLIKGDKA